MKVFICILLIFSGLALKAQNPVFSQYYATGLYLNPALASVHENPFIGINYRSQWSSIDMPLRTFQLTYIHPIIQQGSRGKHLGGVGASFFNDVAGSNDEFKNMGVNIAGTYNFHLNTYGNNFIAVGLQVGMVQNKINGGSLRWGSQYSPNTGYDETLGGEPIALADQVLYPKINIGATWNFHNKKRYALREFATFTGFSISNLNTPNVSFAGGENQIPMLYTLHGGFKIALTEKVDINPNYLLNLQNNIFQTNIGAFASVLTSSPYSKDDGFLKIMAGTWYRLKDSFIFNIGFQTKSFQAGFSYDLNTSSLSRNFGNTGSVEISFSYRIIKKRGYNRSSTPLI